ncbi:MAG TPA: hypothetical protein VMW83_00220 [Spirochaetia bacterium]|nr:hypothetical protein [Spirochaetia bacterium]
MDAALNLPVNEVMVFLDDQEREMRMAVPRRSGDRMQRLGFHLMGGLEDRKTRRASRIRLYTLTPAEMAARGWA